MVRIILLKLLFNICGGDNWKGISDGLLKLVKEDDSI